MTDTGTLHLADYLSILRRRKKQVFRTALLVFLVSAILAFVIPPVYRSSATILIEQQEVPRDLVSSTVTGYANQRLQIIQKRVLTDDNLLKIAEKSQLYTEKLNSESSVKQFIARMRKGIKVETVSANVTDPRSGASMMATIAFTVSFDGDEPGVTQKVTDELTNLLLNANIMIRTQQAERTSGFFSEEEGKLRQHLTDLEAQLAAYKKRNTGRLPELMGLNMSLMERTQKEMEDLDRQITTLEERRLELQGQLATVEPYTGQGPGGRLREVQTQYLSAAAVYAPNHPDVIKLRRELEMLRKETGAVDEREAVDREYKKARAELASAREKYAENHPDVTRQKTMLATLEEKLKASSAATPMGFALKPDNPAYIAIQTQLATIAISLRAANEQRVRAKQKSAEYEGRLIQTPGVEQEGLVLQREYDSTVKKYREIKEHLMGADIAVEMEKEQKGERFSLLVAPTLPDSPEMPNRRAFLLLGIVLGFGSGIGYASIAEYMDRTIRGSMGIASVLRVPPLAVIPHIPIGDTVAESRRMIQGAR
ncbi:MAG: Wzz/FepE/Etk N-terminal domain-containing protein [Sulfuricaulis sp.]|nr:Wzz/FepE/Etk N-terminal domain-containing protein [Sulfuricaulis sp.]